MHPLPAFLLGLVQMRHVKVVGGCVGINLSEANFASGFRSGTDLLALGLDPDLADAGNFGGGGLGVVEGAAALLARGGSGREHGGGLAGAQAGAGAETAAEGGGDGDLGGVAGGSGGAENGFGGEFHGGGEARGEADEELPCCARACTCIDVCGAVTAMGSVCHLHYWS